jgi:excinuclease ABC subunit A
VCCGTPEEVKAHPGSHTGRALRDYDGARAGRQPTAEEGLPLQSLVRQRRAAATGGRGHPHRQRREHNLKSLNVDIPRASSTWSPACQRLGQEHAGLRHPVQRRPAPLPGSLNAYARSIVQPAGRPEVDAVYGIPPTVAIEQRLSRGGRKSTVATTTEVWHFLRLLWVKLGLQHCVHDGAPVRRRAPRASPRSCCATTAASMWACWRRWWSTARASTPTWPSGPRRAATPTCASTASS